MALASGRFFRPKAMRAASCKREVAGRPGVGIAEAEQEIDVGGPGADAMQRGQRRVGLIGLHRGDGIEIDVALGNGLADFLDRLDLGPRQAEPRELIPAREPHRIVMEWIERREQPRPDRRGAGGGKLLAADDGAEPGIAALAAADRRQAGFGENRLPARVLLEEDADGCIQIGLGVNDVRHALGFVAKPSPCRNPYSALPRARTGIFTSATRCRRCSTSTWRVRRADASCCAWRTSTRRAAGPNSRRRSMRTLPGLACRGSSRCGGNPSTSMTTARRSKSFRRCA